MLAYLTNFISNPLRGFVGSRQKYADESQREMTEEDEAFLIENIDYAALTSVENLKIMSRYTAASREAFAKKTNSMVLYLPHEARDVQRLEEQAALHAAPEGYELKHLNGLNIGCGDRRISKHLTPIDIMRESQHGSDSGEHHAFLEDAILANPEDLPFKAGSLDYIVALHMLEHVANPVEILQYWGTLLKPGGGIGLILPDFRYTWNARNDFSQFGHKWNTSVDVFRQLYDNNLASSFRLEQIGTLPYKLSFDVILRKPGDFSPFAISNATSRFSGAQLDEKGEMASSGFDL